MKGYVDGQISTTTSAITTANTNMKGYVDAANTIQSNQISGANAAITTANTNMKGYVDSVANLSSYSNANVTAYLPTHSGNVGASSVNATDLYGTIRTAAQTSITSVGTITTGTWNATTIATNRGGTGLTSFTSGGALYATSTSALTTGTLPVASGGTGTTTSTGSGSVVLDTSPTFTTQISVPLIVKSGTNGVGNIGASGQGFNTVFAKATSAQYADLAEVYTSDRNYIPATVVVFGGDKEVTVSTISHDPSVAGVVSTNPAYLMNDTVEGVAVALQGRVPCRVLGPVSKGDRVVSSDIQGVAEQLDMTKYQPGCIIGKALESIPNGEIATIEVVVGRN